MSSVKARRLIWRPDPDPDRDPDGPKSFLASGIGGQYTIEKRAGGVLLWWAHDRFSFVECATAAEAKEKAEQDWQERFTRLIEAAE